jgi:hypothetical protein
MFLKNKFDDPGNLLFSIDVLEEFYRCPGILILFSGNLLFSLDVLEKFYRYLRKPELKLLRIHEVTSGLLRL